MYCSAQALHVSTDTPLADMDRLMVEGDCAEVDSARRLIIALRSQQFPLLRERERLARKAQRAQLPSRRPPGPPPPASASSSTTTLFRGLVGLAQGAAERGGEHRPRSRVTSATWRSGWLGQGLRSARPGILGPAGRKVR
jgi:hypothetical protein